MPEKRTLKELQLRPCCEQCLREIGDKLQAARELKIALLAAPFAGMFGGHPVEVLYTVLTGDWDDLTHALRAVDPIVRNRCKMIADIHSFDHPGGTLNQFWVTLAESFV